MKNQVTVAIAALLARMAAFCANEGEQLRLIEEFNEVIDGIYK
jgi:hypothetical protein